MYVKIIASQMWDVFWDTVYNTSYSAHSERHLFNGLFSRTTWESRHEKGKTILDFNEARDDGVAVALVGTYANHLHLAPDR